jgi:hypothetical protein
MFLNGDPSCFEDLLKNRKVGRIDGVSDDFVSEVDCPDGWAILTKEEIWLG